MKKRVLLFLSLISSFILFSQNKTFKNINELKEFSKANTKLFYDAKISECFANLSEYWPMDVNEINSLENQTIKYTNIFDDRFGKKVGFSLVKTENIADFAIRETYIIRYEFSAIRVIYTFYNNDSGWIINAFKWDDSFTEEFK